MHKDNASILSVEGLVTAFDTEAGRIRAVENVSLSLKKRTILGLVGESGCGKSVTALSIMRLLPKPAGIIEAGRILFDGADLLTLPIDEMHRIRGRRISMIFQEPMTALNPVHRIGDQMTEIFSLHFPDMPEEEAFAVSVKGLKRVGIPAPEKRMNDYPHQISGGMRQRVMIAMAMACRPQILIADEPTTALDVTIQAQILDEIRKLRDEEKMSVMFITHSLGVIAELCDEVAVMYAGKVVEAAPATELFAQPFHPYTKGLLASIPRLSSPRKTPLPTIEGMVPPLSELPPGCRFQNRCDHAMPICSARPPPDIVVSDGHRTACYLFDEGTRP